MHKPKEIPAFAGMTGLPLAPHSYIRKRELIGVKKIQLSQE
jgi:hypothetical protein